jgi:murein L,D-transpeptidase YcbB/YkuD
MVYRIPLVLLLTSLAGCGGVQLGDKNRGTDMDLALRRTVESSARPSFVTQDQEGARLWKLTRQFYEKREFAPAWIRNDAEPRRQMEALTEALNEADKEGLDPELYGFSALEERRKEASKGFLSQKGFDPKEAGTLDVWLTYLYMKYASDLADGLSDLARADRSWQIKPEKVDPLAHLEQALDENRILDSLLELTPKDSEYRNLRQVLADYKAQASRGGWPKIPATLRLKPGQKSPQLHALAQRLAATGDFKGTQAATYDEPLQDAVKRFQRRHGLADDGIVNPAVVAEMNVPIERRIDQIELNLERWRWLPRDPGSRYLLVNIPEMRLEVRENGKVPLSMRVIVGKKDTPTPIFNDEMSHIVFSPYWNVPPGIAKDETLPALMNDPGFLTRNNMEVVDKAGRTIEPSSIDWMDPASFRFRQRPGSSNALGLVKFMFPNQYNVYLHDTPTDSLFGRAARLFSHGCVRVEQPEELAAYVLRDQPDWTRERIHEAMHAGEERTVKLREPIPVFIGYWTARVAPDGLVQFRHDVYGVDSRLNAMIDNRMRRLRASTTAGAKVTAPPQPEAKKSEKGQK